MAEEEVAKVNTTEIVKVNTSEVAKVNTSEVPKIKKDVFCRSCGAAISKEAEICPECGIRQRTPKNPTTAALLSFFITGTGQIYNGEVGKGIAFIIVQFVNVLLIALVIGLITLPLTWLYGIYDAYKVAEKSNM